MDKKLRPESKMMTHGYNPKWSEGSVKCPIFQTSTFVFESAEDGKAFFELAYGKREAAQDEKPGLIYSRLNNPDLQILEERLCLWNEAEDAAVFESGMAAISTSLLEFCKPGTILLYSRPIYGGSDHFINDFLPQIGVKIVEFYAGQSKEEILENIKAVGDPKNLSMIFCETPANPTNALIDFEICAEIKKEFSTEESPVIFGVDNTYMGPIWQNPIGAGADIVMYSATKYIGGHSDLIAGATTGSAECLQRIKTLRTFLGNMASPHTGWLLKRSLETLKIRMERQQASAVKVAKFLKNHSKIDKVYYLGHLDESSNDYRIWKKQCTGTGAMISFDVKGGEKEAFTVLNSLKLIKLAVSLGSTESLAQHPRSMTHAGIPDEDNERRGVTDSLVRLSVGVEDADDIIWDLEQALANV